MLCRYGCKVAMVTYRLMTGAVLWCFACCCCVLFFFFSSHTIFCRNGCWRPSCHGDGRARWRQSMESVTVVSSQMRRKRRILCTCPARWAGRQRSSYVISELLQQCKILDPVGGKTPLEQEEPLSRSSSFWAWAAGGLTVLRLCVLKCLGRDVNVLIDTGCRVNLMSSSTVDRLGSVDHVSVQHVDSLVWARAWRFVSVQKSAGADGGEQSGGGGSPVPEEAFCGWTNPRTGPDCRPAQNPLLLHHRRWGTKHQRSKWSWWPTGTVISLIFLPVLRK